MTPREYSKLSTATLVNIQGRSAHGSAEERAVREELRRRREEWFALGKPEGKPVTSKRRQPLLFEKETWASMREKETET